MRQRRAILTTATACLALVAAACSGAPRPQSFVAADATTSSTTLGDTGGPTTTTAPTGEVASGGTGTGGGGGGTTATTAPPTTGGSPSGGGGSGGGGQGGGGDGGGGFVADLFKPDEDTIGISDTEIKLCGHAALIFAEAFNIREEDLNVYWEKVNAEGGIYGRKVSVSWEDDAYSPDNAVEAAKACRDEKPFFLLGGIGFDQIPAVRNWAEGARMPYFHHIAVADTHGSQFSFTAQPTVQEVGRGFGEYLVSKYAGKKLGILYRVSENWEPGHAAGKQYLQDHGVDIAADLGVNANQTLFTQQILDMKGKNIEVVWLWENALAAAEFIQQSRAQDFHPVFVVFPFQTTLDVLGDQATRSPIEGVATWPAYKPGGYSGAYAFPQHGYQDEIARFDAAMDEYRPNTTKNDILWQVWIGSKGLHEAFLACGPDCTRNRFFGLMLGGMKDTVAPNCPVDFSRNPHKGGWYLTSHEAFDDGGPWYRTTRWCSEHLN